MNDPEKDVVALISPGGRHYRQHRIHDADYYLQCPGVRARDWVSSYGPAYAPFSILRARPDAYMCGFCFPGWAWYTVEEYLDSGEAA
jgi:hypothetical protein